MLRKESNMPLLSLHALAAARGDGLRPEFVDFSDVLRRVPTPLFPNPLRLRQEKPSNQQKTARLRTGGATGRGKAGTTLHGRLLVQARKVLQSGCNLLNHLERKSHSFTTKLLIRLKCVPLPKLHTRVRFPSSDPTLSETFADSFKVSPYVCS